MYILHVRISCRAYFRGDQGAFSLPPLEFGLFYKVDN